MTKVKLHHHARFETQADWLAHLRSMDGLPNNAIGGENPRTATNDTWRGGTYDKARTLAHDGWREGADKLSSITRAAANLSAPMLRPVSSYDVAGAFPDVPRAVAGDPLNMVNIGDEQIATRPSVRLWVEMGVSCNVTPKQIENYGAALLSQVDAMESADIRCEINLVWTCEARDGFDYQITIVAKTAEQPLDIERLAFLMLHPSQFRRLIFDVMSRDPNFRPVAKTSSYGYCTRITADSDRMGIVIPNANEQTWSYSDLPNAIGRMQSILEAGLTEIGHPMRFDCCN